VKGLDSLQLLLSRKNQRFLCVDNAWPKPSAVKHVAIIDHVAEPPLSDEELARLTRRLGEDSQLAKLYSKYGSLRLYCDSIGDASAFYIARPSEWVKLFFEFQQWMEGLNREEREEFVPRWVDQGVVFGEVPNSGNYFLMAMTGDESGRVYEFEHDGFEFIERGADLSAFLEYLSVVDEGLIQDILTHTRYSDGESDIQWLVNEYHFDEPAL